MRANSAVIASILILSLITGCNKDEQSDQDVAPTPMVVHKKPKAATPNATPGATKSPAGKAAPKAGAASPNQPAPAGNVAYVKQTLGKLNGYLPAAVKALQTNDVTKAKQYAKAFNDNWQQKIIQNNVKTKSPDSYNKITAGVTQVNNLMKAPAPDKTKAIAALQSLSQAVSAYTQSPS